MPCSIPRTTKIGNVPFFPFSVPFFLESLSPRTVGGCALENTVMRKPVGIVLAVSVLLVSCRSLCGDTPETTATSPDHQLTANSYVRDCGATTSFSSIVNVQGASSKFDGNEGQILIVKGKRDISLVWTGPKTLSVRCNSCSRKDTYREVVALGNIDITYE